jgi:hypothetical protein
MRKTTQSQVDKKGNVLSYSAGIRTIERKDRTMASGKSNHPLSFEVPPEQAEAIKKLAGDRQVRLMGKVQGNKFSVDFVACNAAFVACNAAFTACNAPFAKD